MTEAAPTTRARATGVLTMVAAAAVGLASRRPPLHDWPVLGPYGGDACWTIAACGGLRLVGPRWRLRTVALLAWGLSALVECSQLLRIDWLDEIRARPIGALLLGRGFLWSDLVAYAAGAAVWAAVASSMRARRSPSSQP